MRTRIKTRKDKAGKNTHGRPWAANSKYLIAVGTLAAYTTVGGKAGQALDPPQQQAGASQSSRARQPSPMLPVRRFEIPPGPLGEVVTAFEHATGLHVIAAQEGVLALPSPGVTGLYTVERALKILLAGTGVTFRQTQPDGIVLEVQGPSETVVVTDRSSELSSVKYTEPLRDTPQTIMVIPKAVIEEQGATTLRDVLRNVPGLTVAAGEGGTPAGDNLTLRGFSARNDIFVDGVRDLSPQARDPFNMEAVEVTKGPTSAISGRGSTGGTINMVSKTPELSRFFGASLNGGTDATRRATADVDFPLRRLGMGERTAFRMNLVSHTSGVAGRDVVENRRWGAAPSLAFGLGTPTRLTLSYFKLKQNNISDYGIPWVPATNQVLVEHRDRPAPVERSTFYGLRNRDAERMGADTATVRFEHDFSDGISLRNQLRYGRSTRDSIATPPRFVSDNSVAINREMRSWVARDGIWDNQTDFRTTFRTGIEHTLVAGANFTRENNIRRLRSAGLMRTTLWNPNPDDVAVGPITTSPNTGNITGRTQAVYAFDTVKLGSRWEATGGLRWERFAVEGVNTNLENVARTDVMKSLRAGVVYKPTDKGSLYASYGTSLNPSLEGLSYGIANTAIEPEKTYTVEVGSKWEVAGERLMLSGALFRVDKTNARTPAILPDDPPQVLEGKQRASGIELAATGGITSVWKVFAAYTLIDSRIVRSNNPAEIDRRLLNTPKHAASIWTTYRIRKLSVGVGPRFTGRRYGNNTNTRAVGAFWTLDALASYPVTSKVDLRLNLYNLNDAYYFDRLTGGHLVPGPARSAMVSTTFRF